MAVVLGAFITAPVFSVLCKKIINAFAGFQKDLMLKGRVAVRKKSRQKHVLGAPDRPVVHRLAAIPHPPEMPGKVWGEDSVIQFIGDPLCKERTDSIQLILQ